MTRPILSRRLVLGLLAGALATPLRAQSAPLNIVATTGMIADAARRICGDLAELRALMGPGVDPHAYRQTRSDIVALTRADLVLWHGLYLEAQMESFFADLGRQRRVLAVAETLPRDLLRAHDDYADKFDPHVWMAPEIWGQVVANLGAALAEFLPDHAETLAANLATYQAEIAALHTYASTALATIPPQARVLVTAHDAFNYFGAAYGVEVLGIQGMSTESEAGLNRIGELVNLLVARKIGAVFVESSVSDRNMRALIEGAAAQGHEVVIGGQLYSDAMGPEGSYEGTYIGMIDHNITTITRALGGQAPERGMQGMLS